jgi:3',5'-cyclic AMP phosphodiesterase CpdA
MLRLAHISDLHFACPDLNPFQFFSKRWLGNLNFVLKRRKHFDHVQRLPALLPLFKKEKVSHVIISGDLSITSYRKEFEKASAFTYQLQSAGLLTFTIPGNHDHYTASSHRSKLFYHYFPSQFDETSPFNLKEHQVTATRLEPHLWLVALDTTGATSLLSSQGHFTEETERHLETVLGKIPPSDRIILVNHFPFFQNDKIQSRLVRGEALRAVMEKYPHILLYLHGHTHRQIIADLRPSQLPILSDPGSAPEQQDGACHLIQIDSAKVQIQVYRWKEAWELSSEHTYELV